MAYGMRGSFTRLDTYREYQYLMRFGERDGALEVWP